jgi:hypothetical protein
MNTIFKKINFSHTGYQKGFILPFTMLISTLILLVSGSALTLLTKQLYFSKMYKLSQTAYYAADDAISCAIAVDDSYTGADGYGIFPYSTTTLDTTTVDRTYINDTLAYVNLKRANEVPPLLAVPLDGIKCAQSAVFDFNPVNKINFTSEPNFQHTFQNGQVEDGRVVSYNMRMNIGTDPASSTLQLYRCAKITVKKTPSFRQIIAQGYAQCDNPNGSVERAVVNTTEVQ